MPVQSHGPWRRAGEGQSEKPPRTGASLTKRKSDSGGSGTGLGLNRSSAHACATAQLNLKSRRKLTGLTQAAAVTVEDGDRLLKRLSDALRKVGFG